MALLRRNLTDKDLDFIIETVAPEVTDKLKLKQILIEDAQFRAEFLSDEKIFNRVIGEKEVFLKISPTLFFEILLRKTLKDLKGQGYTWEKDANMNIPVFDVSEVVGFLENEEHIAYLADMLSSFTKVENYTVYLKVGNGIWRKVHFNDMDIQSLMSFCEMVDEDRRLGLYKRIADICLFILGLFPDWAERNYRYPISGEVRPSIFGQPRISPEEYEKEGKKFYKLAATHRYVRDTIWEEIFWNLHENFQKAKKPLNFIADNYLRYTRQNIFM